MSKFFLSVILGWLELDTCQKNTKDLYGTAVYKDLIALPLLLEEIVNLRKRVRF